MSRELEVLNCWFFQTGEYDPQWRRPLESTITDDGIMELADVTRHGCDVDAIAIGRMVNNVIGTSVEVEPTRLHIHGGFNRTRARFIIELAASRYNHARIRKVLTGWTDNYGIISRGRDHADLDPDMLLYFNNMIIIQDSFIKTSRGERMQTRVLSVDNMIAGRFSQGSQRGNDYSMRPEDIFHHGRILQMHDDYEEDTTHYNMRLFFTDAVRLSNRETVNPANYLTRILNANNLANKQANHATDTLETVRKRSNSLLGERSIKSDDVLKVLSKRGGLTERGHVPWSVFQELTPDVDDIVIVGEYGDDEAMMDTPDDWTDTNVETIIAHSLLSVIPTMLINCTLQRAEFTINTDTIDGEIDIVIANSETAIASYIEGVDAEEMFDVFSERVRYEVLPALTRNGELSLFIDMVVDTMADTEIYITVNGGSEWSNNYPSFCDTIMSSVISADINNVDRLASNVMSITSSLEMMADTANVSDSRNYASDKSLIKPW